MKKILLFGILFSLNSYSQQLPSKTEIISKMKLVNEYWISQNSNPGNNQWARAAYFTGNMDFYKVYPKESYLQYSNQWANNNVWGLNGGISTRNADNQICGQVYIDLYNLDPVKVPSKIAAIRTSIDNMVYGTKSDDWWWIDALYMAMPVFSRLGVLTNDSVYFNRMYDIYYNNKVTRGLYNTTENLWYRDESYKPPYATKNGEDSYWSRGNGWVFAAYVRVLQLLPLNDSHRPEYIRIFQQMAAALKDRQRADGFWNPSLDDANEFTGPETSGTAFYTYGMAWGINNGMLDSTTYFPAMAKAWNGLVSTAVQTNGLLGYVQGVGAGPAYAPLTSTQDFGVGAFLLAGTEVLKLATGIMPVPTNFGIVSVKAVDKNHVSVSFSKKINETTALTAVHYSIDPAVSVLSIIKGENDSTTMLSVSDLVPGTYTLQINNITSTTGELIEAGETKSFSYSGIAAVTAIGYESGSGNTPDKTLDLDFSTRWSVEGTGQWILYDLGSEKTVQSIDLAFFNGASRKAYFSVNLSTNGADFTEVFNGESSGKSATLANYDFADRDARYVKVIMNGNSTNLWNSITETRINFDDKVAGIQSTALDNRLKIYPNPFRGDQLYLQTNTSPSKVVISDLTGKKVYISDNGEMVLKHLHLKSGAYCLTVYSSEKPESELLIVDN